MAAFLLGRGAPPSPAVVRAANLGAYAYTALTSDHPDRPLYRGEFLASLARHQEIKREVRPLFAAWREAGIEVLLFKGFPLAEYVYPAPGARFHGDIDLVLRPRDLPRAAKIAAELGWSGWPSPTGPPVPHSHLAHNLFRHDGAAWLDVQRFVVHCALPWAKRQRRLTEAVWERSIESEFEGTRVRRPHPVDAALVCLLVHRAWGSETWGLKPHDLLDLRFLVERAGVTRSALEARATELGCRRTLRAMLERCDPWTGRFAVGRPSTTRAWVLDLRTLPEHAPLRLERALRAPSVLRDVIRMLPDLLGARRAARREPDLHRLLTSMTPQEIGDGARPTLEERMRLARAVRWALRLLPRSDLGGCVVRSLALYRALRARGLPVVFVSGVRREGGQVVGHAWVELEEEVLPELVEPLNRKRYSVNFRYPEIA